MGHKPIITASIFKREKARGSLCAHGLFTSVGRADRISGCEHLNKKMSVGRFFRFVLNLWVIMWVRIAENSIITRKLWRSPTTSILVVSEKIIIRKRAGYIKSFVVLLVIKQKGEIYGNKKTAY